jgi:hypothetical protein
VRETELPLAVVDVRVDGVAVKHDHAARSVANSRVVSRRDTRAAVNVDAAGE